MRYKSILLVLLLVFTVVVMVGCTGSQAVEAAVEKKYVAVEVQRPQTGQLSLMKRFSGSVAVDNRAVVAPKLSLPEKVVSLTVAVGDRVEKGQVLATLAGDTVADQIKLAKEQYDLARANYANQMTSYQHSREHLARVEALYKAGATSKAEYDQAKLQASNSQVTVMREQLAQAKTNYQIQVEQRQDMTLTAPISGTVTAVNLTVDTLATAQSTITIIDDRDLEIVFSVPESQLFAVRQAGAVQVDIPAVGKVYEGTISTVSSEKQARTNFYRATATLSANQAAVQAGMTAYVSVINTKKAVYLLPIDALLVDDDGDYVYVVEREVAVKRYVELGDENGEVVEVTDGIGELDRIVVKGQNFIEDDSVIKVVGD